MTAPAPILSSMKQDGSRLMIHPADVKGKWTRRRRLVFYALIAFYVLAPFIPVGGHPMIQLDVEHRSFYLFGQTFNSQDVWLVLLLALSFVFAMLLVTAWHGRFWCGYACPQSVFMEGVYRPVERFWEGPRERRLKAIGEKWTAPRVARRVGKLATFLLISMAIAHTATAIFVSPKELELMILEGPGAHREAFLITTIFTAILMFNFTWFREQFCVVLCPYGRLQSVLHDRQSVVVTYDEKRGEPRGRAAKAPAAGAPQLGDCVDCKKCVQACPTGIDIRNGLQMECLACNQCMDACDDVMGKLKRPQGLIRFMSQAEIATGKRQVLRPRLFLYGTLMILAMTTLGVSLAVRSPFEANVFRPRGANPFVIDGTVVRNAFEVHLFNKNPQPGKFHIALVAPVDSKIIIGTPDVELGSLKDSLVPVMVSIERANLAVPVDLKLLVTDETAGAQKELTVRFLAPPGLH